MQPFQYLDIDPTLSRINSSITAFTADLNTWYDNRPGSLVRDALELQKHSCLLMYRLFDYYYQGEESEVTGKPGRRLADQTVCLALLIFVIIVTEPDASSVGPRFTQAVTRLRAALERIPTTHWKESTALLLWIVTLATLGAKKLPRLQRDHDSDYFFFIQYFKSASEPEAHADIRTEELLNTMLETCPWVAFILDTRAKRLWSGMGLCAAEAMEVVESSSEDEGQPVDSEYAVGQSTALRFFPARRGGKRSASWVSEV